MSSNDDFDFDAFVNKYGNKNNDEYVAPISSDSDVTRLEEEYLKNRNLNAADTYNLDNFNAASRRTEPRPAPKSSKKKKQKKSSGGKKALGVLIAIIAIICAIAIAISGLINSVLGKINYDEKVENQYVDTNTLYSENGIYNVLFLGVDARVIRGEDAKNSRSDSMMLVSIDTKHQCIKTISFLRDTWVYIPCKDTEQRLNAACQYGGYSGVVDTIEYNFGVNIDGYVVVDFHVFQNLVDALGGVEIEVTEAEAKEVNNHKIRYGNAKLEAGKHILTGKQTLAYCRIRKIDTDFMRAYRQRTVIKSIISGVKSKPTKIYSIANNCAEFIETDLSKRELKKLSFNLTKCIKNDMLESRVPFDGTWSYATINGNSVITIDKDANKKLLIDYIYNKTYDQIVQEEQAKENK